MDVITYVVLALGLVYLITQSAIFAPLRILFASKNIVAKVFIYCPACTGFWVGLFLAPLWPLDEPLWFKFVLSPFASMLLGHTWTAWTGGNSAYQSEQGQNDE